MSKIDEIEEEQTNGNESNLDREPNNNSNSNDNNSDDKNGDSKNGGEKQSVESDEQCLNAESSIESNTADSADALEEKEFEEFVRRRKERLQQEEEVTESIGFNEKGPSKSTAIIKEILTYAIIFLLCVFIIPRYVVQKTIVDGESMEETLKNKDHLLVEKVSYRFTDPDRFDIVVFHPYGKDADEYYVKRVIGLPGETVQIIGSEIFINGEKLEENFGKDPIHYAGIAKEPLTLSDDEFFLLGDNREISLDSRWEEVGLVHREFIEGHAFLRIWPLRSFGFFHD